MDAGSVLTVGELGLQRTLEKEKSKLDDTDAPLISFSPNIGKKKPGSRSEPGVFGSLEPEPEPIEKKTRSRSRSRLEKKVRSRSR